MWLAESKDSPAGPSLLARGAASTSVLLYDGSPAGFSFAGTQRLEVGVVSLGGGALRYSIAAAALASGPFSVSGTLAQPAASAAVVRDVDLVAGGLKLSVCVASCVHFVLQRTAAESNRLFFGGGSFSALGGSDGRLGLLCHAPPGSLQCHPAEPGREQLHLPLHPAASAARLCHSRQ